MEIRLVLNRKGARGRALHLKYAQNVLGRSRECQVRLAHAEVSRRHCMLRLQHGYLTVEDLDSSNGTYLNGERIQREEVVRPGDTLEIGPFRVVAEYHLSRQAIDRLLALADVEPASVQMEVEEELPVLEDIGPSTVRHNPVEESIPVASDERLPAARDESEDDEPAETDDPNSLEGWRMGDGGDVRDMLAAMDDKPKPKKRKSSGERGV